MLMTELITKKRDGGVLNKEEIDFMIEGYTHGDIPDYQMSAMLMAMYFRGLNKEETVDLTMAMMHSGDTIDLSAISGVKADKHSTGGVGDKTSLVLCPMVAAQGVKMAKMSGRGLGHTGGTIDKLESFPGFSCDLSSEKFFENVNTVGFAIAAQTADVVPADKKLYALRDVTATVDNLSLIASSIMSKKLAAGSHTIVLDVKCGSGAFMKTPEDAKELAEAMVKIGNNCGRNTAAVITNMDRPLGNNIGNSLEVIEAVEVLKNNGPEDLKEVCLALSSEIVSLSKNIPIEEARKLTEDALSSGKAFEKFKEWISSQGGKREWVENTDLFPKATHTFEIKAEKDGYISKMDAESIGIASVILGAGRETKDDTIDMSAGIVLNKKTGDKVEKGDILATLYSCNEKSFESSKEKFLSALEFSENPIKEEPLVFDIVR